MFNKGDVVIMSDRTGSSVTVIDRVTKTQAIIMIRNYTGRSYEKKFWRENGREVGGDKWWWATIHHPKPGEADGVNNANRRKRLMSRLSAERWQGCTLDQLERIAAILNENGE